MNEIIHSQGSPRMLHSALQSEAIYRNGQRTFIVPDNRNKEWAWAVRFIRVKTAFNYWRNGYKWRTSWVLAQR